MGYFVLLPCPFRAVVPYTVFLKVLLVLIEIVKLKRGNLAGNIVIPQVDRLLSQTLQYVVLPIILLFLLSLHCCFRPQVREQSHCLQ